MKDKCDHPTPTYDDRVRIVELFQAGKSYSEIRAEFGLTTKTFVSYHDFLNIIGVTSKQEYLRKHANYKRKVAYRDETGTVGARKNARDKDGNNWPVVRKRVIDSNYGICLFCEKDAQDVHHVLGLREGHDSRFLIPVCKNHHKAFHSKKYVKNGESLVQIAALLNALYPKLFITIRKSVRPNHGQFLSYAIATFGEDRVGFLKEDPYPGWESTPDPWEDDTPLEEQDYLEMEKEEEEFRKRLEESGEDAIDDDDLAEETLAPELPRYVIEFFYIVVSENGYDLKDWCPGRER